MIELMPEKRLRSPLYWGLAKMACNLPGNVGSRLMDPPSLRCAANSLPSGPIGERCEKSWYSGRAGGFESLSPMDVSDS